MCQGKESNKKKGNAEEQSRKVFVKLDGDGRMSSAEVEELSPEMEELLRKVMEVDLGDGDEGEEMGLREAFAMYEEDHGCGRITPDSLKRMLSRLGDKRSVGECQQMISAFDLDRDGVLSFHEFKLMLSS